MGKFFRFIARIGAVGGTARSVANGYRYFSSLGLSQKNVFEEILKVRFKILKANKEESELFKKIEHIENLTDFTFSILQAEGVLKDFSLGQNIETTLVIMEELRKKGIPEEIIRKIN